VRRLRLRTSGLARERWHNLIGGTSFLRGTLTGLEIPPLMVMVVMMLIVVVRGTFREWIAIISSSRRRSSHRS
jgi:hypothetical protein